MHFKTMELEKVWLIMSHFASCCTGESFVGSQFVVIQTCISNYDFNEFFFFFLRGSGDIPSKERRM